jgi:hypothetical protein
MQITRNSIETQKGPADWFSRSNPSDCARVLPYGG